jgi:hypothetical protein
MKNWPVKNWPLPTRLADSTLGPICQVKEMSEQRRGLSFFAALRISSSMQV